MGFQDPATVRPEDVLDGTLNPNVIIEGNLIRTAATGRRWEITSTDGNRIRAFSGTAGEVGPGGISVDTSGGRSDMTLAATDMPGAGLGASLRLSTWDQTGAPLDDEAQITADVIALSYQNGNAGDRVLYDKRGRIYRALGSNLGNAYDVVLAQYMSGYASASTRGAWSYLGPDGFVTMGGRTTGPAINVPCIQLPNTLNTPGGLDHRPTEQLHFVCYGNGAAVNVRIDPNGQVVQTSGVPTNLSLSNIRFPVF